MSNVSEINCTVPNFSETIEGIVRCSIEGNSLSAAEIANWGILIIAGLALIVSFFSMLHARNHADQTLAQNLQANKDQLNASHEATRADLDERKNSRELDITAQAVTAIDELQIAVASNPEDEGRSVAISSAASKVMSSFSRFDLFVGQSRSLRTLLTWLITEQQKFEPKSLDDFETKEFNRMVVVQSILRMGLVEFQASRKLSPITTMIQEALSSGKVGIVDQLISELDLNN